MKLLDFAVKDALRPDGAPKAEKLMVKLQLGREVILAEHFSDQPEGEFHEIPITKVVRAKRRRVR